MTRLYASTRCLHCKRHMCQIWSGPSARRREVSPATLLRCTDMVTKLRLVSPVLEPGCYSMR